eukprot:SAG31_NODE_20937_length_561_cov_2.158009_1_plen_130_part_01
MGPCAGRMATAMLFLLALALGLRAGVVAPQIGGIHVDDESCSGLVKDGVVHHNDSSCIKYIRDLQQQQHDNAAVATALGLPHKLRVVVDAGTAWVCYGDPGPDPTCTNITYDGVTRSVADHVIHFSDEAV